MSRAKDPKFIEESQKIFKGIRKVSIILSVALVVFVAYSVVLKKDPEVATIEKISQEQRRKVTIKKLTPYMERIRELKKDSEARILSETELQELKWLLLKTKEVRKKMKEKYSLKKIKKGQKKVFAVQKWQFCWVKRPGYRGDSPLRRLCLPAKILKKSENYLAVSYGSSQTNGVIEVTAGGDKVYIGTWKDAGGWGKVRSLYFTSSRTATGWLDEKGQGSRKYSFVLERLN